MLKIIVEILLLVTAISVDAFLASLTYGINKIKIPFSSLIVLSGISSLILGISMLAGSFISVLLPNRLTNFFCFLILFILGLYKLTATTTYENSDSADVNHDKLLSPKEALALGIMLSLDSIAAGIGVGMIPIFILTTIITSFVIGSIAILAGSYFGNLLATLINKNLCWVSGILLILLAISKLF